MVSTSEGVTDNSHIVTMTSTPFKKPRASKSLCLFTRILDFKPIKAKHCIAANKSKRRAMKVGTSQWTNDSVLDSYEEQEF